MKLINIFVNMLCGYNGRKQAVVTTILCHGYLYYRFMHTIDNCFDIDIEIHVFRQGKLQNCHPTGTRRKNSVIMTSKRRRFDVIMTLLLRFVPFGQGRISQGISAEVVPDNPLFSVVRNFIFAAQTKLLIPGKHFTEDLGHLKLGYLS